MPSTDDDAPDESRDDASNDAPADNRSATPKPPTPPAETVPRLPLREAPSQILLQTDKSGILVPTPVFAPTDQGEIREHILSWDVIDRLLQLGADQQNGRANCDRMTIRGTSHGERAHLEIEMTFSAPAQRWVRAPVGLATGVITNYEAPAGGFLQYDEADGFVFWMAPARVAPRKADHDAEVAAPPAPDPLMMPVMPSVQRVERRLKIEASFAVTATGLERRLVLRTPYTASAHIDLLVDTPDAQASLLGGGEALVETRAAGTGGTQITASPKGGEMVLLWRPRRAPAVVAPAVLESQGIVQVNLDDNARIDCQAQLTLRSRGEPFDRFTVTLPPGLRITPSPSSEYEVTALEAAATDPASPPPDNQDGVGNTSPPQRVEVRLRQPTIGPATVRLNAVSAVAAQNEAFVEVGGFEVLEAVEEWGHVLVTAAGEHSITWIESPQVVQVDESPALLRRSEAVVARFRYDAQPFSLQIKAGPKRTRLHVEPMHQLEIASDHVRLTATLKCRIHGAKASALRVDLEGWEVESLGGDEVVNEAGADLHQLAPLEVPFREPVSGEVTVRLSARLAVSGDRGRLRLPLPMPHADFLASALVAVAPSDNLEITPLPDESQGLIPESPTTVEGLASGRRASIFYRTRTGEPKPVLAVEYEVKSGSVLVETDNEVRLREQSAAVRQTFSYVFAYEPVKRLAVEAPRAAYESGDLQFLFEGEPIIPTPADESNGPRIRLRLEPPAMLGRRTLTAEYSLPLPEVAPQKTVAHAVPLIVPVFTEMKGAARIGFNTTRVLFGKPYHVAPDESEWRPREPSTSTALGATEQLVLAAEGSVSQLPLIITRTQPEQIARNALDRVWLQTWLTANQRRDRAVFRFAQQEQRLQFRLPQGVDAGSVIVLVNGVRGQKDEHFVVESSGDRREAGESVVTLELSAFGDAPEHVVEVWYGFRAPRPRTWKTRLEPPRMVQAGWVRRVYWQVILPSDEHVLRSPPGLNPEQTWQWNGWRWERRAVLAQQELEQWIGASEQPAPISSNYYLYSAFGEPIAVELYTVRRGIAVLGLSGLTLLFGLRILRAPSERRRAATAQAAFAAAVLAAAAAVMFPETSVLVAQAAVFGVICVAAAWIFAQISQPAESTTAFPLAPSSHETASLRPPPSGRRSSYATTATVPGPLASSPTDSES